MGRNGGRGGGMGYGGSANSREGGGGGGGGGDGQLTASPFDLSTLCMLSIFAELQSRTAVRRGDDTARPYEPQAESGRPARGLERIIGQRSRPRRRSSADWSGWPCVDRTAPLRRLA